MEKKSITQIIFLSRFKQRPGDYHNRGVNTIDLNTTKLLEVYRQLLTANLTWGESFLRMTFAMPTLGAKEFLTTLYLLADNNFKYEPKKLFSNDLSTPQGHLLGEAMYCAHRKGQDDLTDQIKAEFYLALPKQSVASINEAKPFKNRAKELSKKSS